MDRGENYLIARPPEFALNGVLMVDDSQAGRLTGGALPSGRSSAQTPVAAVQLTAPIDGSAETRPPKDFLS